MDTAPQKSHDVDMEEDADSVQECTEAEVNDQLGPRSTSGLSDSMGAVSLEVSCVFKTQGVYKGVEYTIGHHPPPNQSEII